MPPLLEWAVEKSTTEKLQSALNEASEAGREVEQIEYMGGRDWIVISYRELQSSQRVL